MDHPALPLAFLKLAAQAALKAISGGSAGDALASVMPHVLDDFHAYLASQEASARHRELQALALVGPDPFRQAIKQVIAEVAPDQPLAVRRQLARYLSKVPETIRKTLRRPEDPGGTTVPPSLTLQKPADLLPFLPPKLEPSAAEKPEQRARTMRLAGTDTAAAVRLHLQVTAGPHKGREFSFAGHDTFLVGRSKRAHFQLSVKDKFFSRVHFLVEVNPPRCRLIDMGSRNGTIVNGQRVESADLKDGDQIQAGHTIMRLRVEGGSANDEAPTLLPEDPGTVEFVPTLAPWSEPSPGGCPSCGAALNAAQGPSLCPACLELSRDQPQSIPGYQLVRHLGRGGMGIVWLAVPTAGGAPVAIKTITPAVAGGRSQLERFLREARILQQLDHPNIVAFRDMGQAAGQAFFAMDYVPGTDAALLLRQEGPLPVRRAVGLVCQLLLALEYAHAKGFVHRDIKPANLLVMTEHGSDRVKLADFGLARVYQASELSGLTLQGDVGGTMAFMAPEQISRFRESKPGVDQYAAAATLYTLLTGQPIYDLPRRVQERILMVLHEDPIPLRKRRADLPAELAEIVHRALAREPQDRFPDVKAMRHALLAIRT
jgi:serine/threonine-protein kinase